jgi:polygalacturonase
MGELVSGTRRGEKRCFKLAALAAAIFTTICCAFRPAVRAADVDALEHLRPATPAIPDRDFTVTDFGAVGDGRTMNTNAFQRAIAAVQSAGGGRLIVPKGVFRTGPFKLCSQIDLHLKAGAVIQAPDTFEELGVSNSSKFIGAEVPDKRPRSRRRSGL